MASGSSLSRLPRLWRSGYFICSSGERKASSFGFVARSSFTMINNCIELIGWTSNANTEGKHACRIVVSKTARRRHFGRR
jgi:hypothetical protein